jgi:hypothetical protein
VRMARLMRMARMVRRISEHEPDTRRRYNTRGG